MDEREFQESNPREGGGSGDRAATPGRGDEGVRSGSGERGDGLQAGGVDVPKRKRGRPKGSKSLNKKSGRTNVKKDAAKRAQSRLGTGGNQKASTPILPFEATLAYAFKGAGGKETCIGAARLIQDQDERVKRFVYAYDSASDTDKKVIILEDLCSAADIPPDELLGLIIPALWKRNVDISKLIAAVHHPEIVEATIQAAKGPFGMPDRKMLHDSMGFLPQKPGMQISIDASRKTLVAGGRVMIEDGAIGLPSFEQDAIEGAQAVRGDAGMGKVGQKEITGVIEAEFVSSDKV